MKKLALVLCLVLAFGSVAHAVTPTFSSTITLSGSETWTDGKISADGKPGTPAVSMSVAASGSGYNVKAAIGNTNAPALGKYSAALSDGKFIVNIWGNAETLNDKGTPFGKIKAAKESAAGNWRLRATYGDTVVDLDNNTRGLVKAFTQRKLSNTLTVGGAIQKNLSDVKDGNYIVDAWAQTKVGTIDLSGEAALFKNAGSTKMVDRSELVVKGVTDIGMGINATGQFDLKIDPTKTNPYYNNTNITLKKSDLNLSVNGILTNTYDDTYKTKVSATYDTGLNYLYAHHAWNLGNKYEHAVNAIARTRGSNDQGWADVFKHAKNEYLKNKTYAAAVTGLYTTATGGADANPSINLTVDGTLCAVPSKVWLLGQFATTMDKDLAANKMDIMAKATYKDNLAPKIAMDNRANLDINNISTATQSVSGDVSSMVQYLFNSNMYIYGKLTESVSKTPTKTTFTNTAIVGYYVKF
jgi:hypothetical protein